MPILTLSDLPGSDFDVTTGDLGQLEIRDAGAGSGFHYFYDSGSNRLIKNFLLEDRERVATLCEVRLIKKGDLFSPRLRLWKRDKSQAAHKRVVATEAVDPTPATVVVKASVDTNDCYEAFWRLIDFLRTFSGIEVSSLDGFRIASADDVALADALNEHDREAVFRAVKSYLGGSVSQADVDLLVGRREQLEYFDRLLHDDAYFDAEVLAKAPKGPEQLWQLFFEANPWIFGYGLNLVSCEQVSKPKLEQMTTGANVFTGGGKRSDAVMRTRGFVSSLLFGEIKTHRKDLLMAKAYREPDVYQVSPEVSGGVSQLQKTAHKAVKILRDLHQQYAPDGSPDIEVATLRPRQVLVVGSLEQLVSDTGANLEKVASFELYRRSIHDLEIITFDELYERALFIVSDDSGVPGD